MAQMKAIAVLVTENTFLNDFNPSLVKKIAMN